MNKLRLLGIGIVASAMTFGATGTHAQQWELTGNFVTNPGNQIGATNAADLVMVANNTEGLRLTAGSQIIATWPILSNGGLDNNGPLNSNGGPISLNSNGSTQFTGNGGPFDINNTGGSLNLNCSGGPLTLHNGNGPIDIASNFGPIDINSNQGPIDINSNGNSLNLTSGGVDINLNPGSGSVRVNGSGVVSGAWSVLSDARFKKEINTLDNALAKVMQLRGVSYFYKADVAPQWNFPAGRQIGFIAQEVEQVVPELVLTSQEGYKSVAYQNITALLTEAVKTQQAKIQSLETQLQAQLARIARLEALIGASSTKGQPTGTDQATPADIR